MHPQPHQSLSLLTPAGSLRVVAGTRRGRCAPFCLCPLRPVYRGRQVVLREEGAAGLEVGGGHVVGQGLAKEEGRPAVGGREATTD